MNKKQINRWTTIEFTEIYPCRCEYDK